MRGASDPRPVGMASMNCAECGKEFMYERRKTNRQFCGSECKNIAQSRVRTAMWEAWRGND